MVYFGLLRLALPNLDPEAGVETADRAHRAGVGQSGLCFSSRTYHYRAMPLHFEWDEAKAGSNFAKHGVSFEEASTVFGDPLSLTIPDPAHSQREDRWIVLGHSHQRRLLVVVHTERGDNIRIISARRASRHERKSYEESN